jgi:hypothetical protein
MLNTEDFLSVAPTELPDKIKSGELSNEEFARNFARFLLDYKSIRNQRQSYRLCSKLGKSVILHAFSVVN